VIRLTPEQIARGGGDPLPFELADRLTVAVRLRADTASAERVQTLVAQWQLRSRFDAFSAYDAGCTDGLACAGYMGGVFDGRYLYFSPNRDTRQRASVHGRVLRYDTHGEFRDPGSYTAFDVEQVTDLRTVNYYGAAFDGRHIYFSPQDDGGRYHTRMLRYDTRREFVDAASWEAHDLGMTHSHQGIAFDGRYVYFPPGYEGTTPETFAEDDLSSCVVRYDTSAAFHDPASWQTFDSRVVSERAANFDGGAFDGRYLYFVPLSTGVALRYDTHGDFHDRHSWQHHDVGRFSAEGWFVGAVFDGRFLYLVAYAHAVIVRYDTLGDFTEATSWSSRDVDGTDGLGTGGFDGGLFDGRYVYFIPWSSAGGGHHGNFLRFDTLGAFDDPASWTAHDTSFIDGMPTIGYNGGVFDGRYLYGAPVCDDDAFHGRILRYDTLDEGTFALRYADCGHNGGLCAAVPGPSFVVNAPTGPVGVAAHRVLDPGPHDMAGVYDGRRIRLLVDGVCLAEGEGTGTLQPSAAPVTVGQLEGGAAAFDGTIERIVIADTALDGDGIRRALGDTS
jgi:hypothetical protein